MKILRYILLILLTLYTANAVLIRMPGFQDQLFKRFVRNAQEKADLKDNSLSALVCGSRSPLPSPNRAESCIMINAGGKYYVIDVGNGSAENINNWRIDANKIEAVLLTHLHSDHISDLADFHQMTWVNSNRNRPLDVFGPEGVKLVTQGFEDAYRLDYKYRNEHHGGSVANIDNAGFKPHQIDLNQPIIIDDNGLKVTAFNVTHDPVVPALGYRFDFRGRSIVISGDTSYSENLIHNSKGADVLFHEAQANHILQLMKEVINDQGAQKILDDIQTYHTTPLEAAQIANLAKIQHLIFYHLTPAPRNSVMEKMFFRGVNDVRKDWTPAKDGTLVVLPLGTDEIVLTEIN